MGVANGAARVALYEKQLGEKSAHQVSTASGIALFLGYTHALDRRWPILQSKDAVMIGAGWAAGTILFEFGFGHYVAGDDWSTLLRDYDIRHGRTWPFAVAAIAAAPWLVRRVRERG